jgi:hypothetical protein
MNKIINCKYAMLFVCFALSMGLIFMKTIDLRPLNIKVVDAVTEEPLEGILVYRILESYHVKDRVLIFIPSPSPSIIRKLEIGEEYHTDKYGVVNFDSKKIDLWFRQKIYYECLSVNLELDMNKVPEFIRQDYATKFHLYNSYSIGTGEWRDKFFRPNPKYRGANILNGEKHLWPEGYVDQSFYENVDFYWNEVKWGGKGGRTITVRLKQYDPEEAAKHEERREESRRKYLERRDRNRANTDD